MSGNSFVSLDWRDAPSSEEIVQRILRVFDELDGTVSLVQGEDGVFMIRRRDNKGQQAYFYKLWRLGLALVNLQVSRQALKARFMAYTEVEPSLDMSLDQVKRLILDLALTIKVHPTALGIKGEGSGQFFLPTMVRIVAKCITDVFDYNTRQRYPDKAYSRDRHYSAGLHSIPPTILSLDVFETKQGRQGRGRVDAVLVFEHRNLDEVLLKKDFAIENVIIVMTAGFPDATTKEFLHLLSRNKILEDRPFLYFGDHDPPGFSIFQVLKYGSRASAWVSPISVCSQLEYVGPTVSDLEKSAMAFRTKWEERYRVDNPHATDDQVKKAADRWQAKAEGRIEAKITNLTRKDKQTLQSFDRVGWLRHEQLARQELSAMKRTAGVSISLSTKRFPTAHCCALRVFRFANLAEAGVPYVKRFVEARVQEACPNREYVSQLAVATGTPSTIKFRNLPSQSIGSQQTQTPDSQRNADPVNLGNVAETSTPAQKQSDQAAPKGTVEAMNLTDVPEPLALANLEEALVAIPF